MIGKIKKGKSFAGLTKYILEKEQAELICTNLAGETHIDFYRQLTATQQLNPRVRSPVSHISISFPFDEKPENQELEEIVEETLLGMGFKKNLYFAASHNDCNHFHLHIAASRINIDGECVSDWYDKRRLEKVLRNLEIQCNLTSVTNSWSVERTAPSTGQKRRMFRENQEFELGLRNKPADKSAVEKIQDAIETAIQPGVSFAEFIEKLKLADVETSLKFNSEGIIQGISYSTDGVAFAGSKLGRNHKASTLKGLTMRGIKFDHYRDDLLTRHETKDEALEPKTNRPMRSKNSQIEFD
ncbi:relaxase/mobilization nuclease domain-containing protein [Plectonema cf. radiosum LEGE 06105]|uniref:Relaxase/mobilization nuclease domain-containing protein n=1 Tax=Plectonema cf. radiosum LEGE 06105 TaxID=945769 RepID=A0A8J7F8R0_9CYAN|nr:relaxase/mobilization nuclease domain-containing protein [Plectonema radiosum]MBE9216903.1 relaxase/mobilization nuclease domain-containing protein [Plectonema cf. radiosum LEGE 06105]